MAVIIIANEIDYTQNKVLRDSFSYEALQWLHQYYQDYSDMRDKDIEFDPVAIRCDWSEYEPAEAWRDYRDLMDMYDIEKDDTEGMINALERHYHVVVLKRGTLLIRQI
tara:strand:- start:44 stop:370 length:327 start_codon:yes stop_codon:yes gene_type:complete